MNVVIVGGGERARRIADQLEKSGEFEVCGFLDDEPRPSDLDDLGERFLGGLDELRRLAIDRHVERVIYALPRRFLGTDATANLISLCEILGVQVTIPFDLFETRAAKASPDEMAGIAGLTISLQGKQETWRLHLKRALDVVIAAVALIATAPIWLATMIAIKLDSPGPVFFSQDRCGKYGRPFRFHKFRTMYNDAESRLAELRSQNEQSGPVFKIRKDPRITRVGAFLRRYSIDELPQLVNVLRGEMSIVGPRPPLPAEVAQYELDQRVRLSMRPGITCLWQISGRNEIPFGDWVKLDLEYIDRWSLWLDFEIMLLTVPAVISGRGAS